MWIDDLSEEDLNFLKKFVLNSGSLKELASAYDVTYPTIRLRLDRLIEKIRILDEMQNLPPFERTLRAAFSEGRMDVETFKQLLQAFREGQ